MTWRGFSRIAFLGMAMLLGMMVALLPAEAGARGALVFEKTNIDAGKFPEGQEVPVAFPVRNSGSAPVRIANIRTSCGCTAAGENPSVLEPGAEDVINVVFRTHGRRGRQHSNITVETDDPGQAAYQLRLALEVTQDVYLGEPMIDLGVLPPGEGAEKTFSLFSSWDRELEIGEISSSHESITAELVDSRPYKKDDESGTEYRFRLNVPNSLPLGDFYSSITIATNWGSAPLRQNVRGRVLGNIDFNPKQFFLVMAPNAEGTATVTFTSRTTEGFEIVDLGAEARGVTVEMEKREILPRRHEVIARIKSPERAGTFMGTVKLSTKMENEDTVTEMSVPLRVLVRAAPQRN